MDKYTDEQMEDLCDLIAKMVADCGGLDRITQRDQDVWLSDVSPETRERVNSLLTGFDLKSILYLSESRDSRRVNFH